MYMTELILFMVLCINDCICDRSERKKDTDRVMKEYERVTEKERHWEKQSIVFSLTFAWLVLISQARKRFR